MFKRNKDGVVLEWDADTKKFYPRRATKKYFEQSKAARLASKKSRKINRK